MIVRRAGLAADGGQTAIGIIRTEAQAILGTRGEHAVGFIDLASQDIVNEYAQIALRPCQNDGIASRELLRPVDAAPQAPRLSRLRICDLTARVLKTGLRLLGIETIERM